MATIEDGAVFEYCINAFKTFDNQDGGYYPSKHDKKVFEQAASYYSISVEKVEQIFMDYSKQAADLEMEQWKRLPRKKYIKKCRQRARDIFVNNKDLPFFKIEGPPSEDLTDPMDILTDEYSALIGSIAQSGWTIPLTIDVKRFKTLEEIADNVYKIDNFFFTFYDGRELRAIWRKTTKALSNSTQVETFSECTEAYINGLYTVCLTTLLTVLEGVISSFGDDPRDVRIMRICKYHADDEIQKKHSIKGLCWLSMYEYIKVLYEKSDFSKPEPSSLNRHWVQHGCTEKSMEQIDCIRVFNALSTMTSIIQNQVI